MTRYDRTLWNDLPYDYNGKGRSYDSCESISQVVLQDNKGLPSWFCYDKSNISSFSLRIYFLSYHEQSQGRIYEDIAENEAAQQ